MTWRGRWAVAAALTAVLLTACGTADDRPITLTIFAAASLRDAMDAVEEGYEAVWRGVDLVVATDSSTALRTQITEGAPADVFLSADIGNAQALADEGLASGAVVVYAGNTLALVVPPGNPADIATPADLAADGVAVITAGEEVPIARYAGTVVANLASLPGYPDDFAERYAANIVSAEANVGAVLAKIELGEGDAAFVYRTDAIGSGSVLAIEIPAEANLIATYGGVVVAASAQQEAAAAFLGWLAGPDGQAVLAEFGFDSP